MIFGGAIFGASPEGEPGADPDGDGAVNTAEFLGLTNPLHGGSFLRPNFSLTGGNIFVQFNVPANRSAVIETTFDFANWSLWDVPGNGDLCHANNGRRRSRRELLLVSWTWLGNAAGFGHFAG